MFFADVPDHDIIRVGDTYYMVSTTMHFAPGCGIMKSKDLTNWETVNYAYDALVDGDNFRLLNGRSEYSQGQWATNLRYDPYEGLYYIFMIQGMDGQRQEIVWRLRDLFDGRWEGRLVFGGEMVDADGKVVMRTNGIGQGGIVQANDGKWWCFLFKDFCGYRFALFHYATQEAGGAADFDYFRVK